MVPTVIWFSKGSPDWPSIRVTFELVGSCASFSLDSIISLEADWNTGVLYHSSSALAAHPSSVSMIWPRFMRDGTPRGFSTMSMGVPSSMYGISSIGRTRATTPLFPWRPASLSPSWRVRLAAMRTLTTSSTPGSSSSPSVRLMRCTSMTVPSTPWGTRREVSRTSLAFSPKIEFRSLNSGVESVSLLGVTFPTRMEPAFTIAPTRMIPSSSSCSKACSLVFGMSRVIFSGPSFVSRISTENSLMWIEVKASSSTTASETRMASS